MSSRRNEISLFNIILCMLVVLIHVLSATLASLTLESPLCRVTLAASTLSSFAVPGFIFVSGVKTFLSGRKQKYVPFMKKRLTTIIVPYIAAVTLYYIYFVFFAKYFPFSWRDLTGYILRGDLAAQFYFILIILQCYLLYPLWQLLLDKADVRISVTVSAIIMAVFGLYWFYISDKLFPALNIKYTDRLLTTYILYWTGGIYAGKYYDKFIGFLCRKVSVLGVLFVLAAVFNLTMVFLFRYEKISWLHINACQAVYNICAILFVFALTDKFKNIQCKFLATIDYGSYYIYLTHVMFVLLSVKATEILGIGSATLSLLFRAAVTYGLSFAVAYVYAFLKKRK